MTTLPFDSYYGDFIYLEFLKKVLSNIYLVLFVLIVLVFYNKKLFMPWSKFEKGKTVRTIVLISAIILAWVYATYDFNLYFNQGHYLDRSLLVFLVFLIYWRPVFVVPFLTVLLSVIGQFEILSGFSMAAPFLLIRIIILFLTFYVINLLNRTFRFTDFVFMTGCLLAAHYFLPGSGKFNPEWILNDQINYLLPATYANGWLSFIDYESISELTKFLGWFNVPSRIFTLIVECGMVLFFLNLKWTRYLMIGAIIMHIGVFAFSGIFFWMWFLVLIALLISLFKESVFQTSLVFNKRYFLISILLIGLGDFWCDPVRLAWHDSPLSYTYKLQAETENGELFQLPPNYFSPYDYQFTLSNFKYISSEPLLGIVWGGTGKSISRFFKAQRSKKEIFEFEKNQGRIYNDPKLQKAFEEFVKQYVRNWNQKSPRKNNLSYVQAPRLLWTFPKQVPITREQKIIRVLVMETTSYYSNAIGYNVIRKRLVSSIPIVPL